MSAASASASTHSFSWRDDYKLNTLDIVVAVLLGVIEAAIEIVGALGFLERTVWLAGGGGFAIYAIYNGTTWILPYVGVYLRKRAGVLLLTAAVVSLVRWFMGDPDGPLLLWYGLFPAFWGAITFTFLRWRGANSLFAISCALCSGMNQVSLFIALGGFDMAEGPVWGILSIILGGVGGLLWGVVARYLGIGLEKTGVPSVSEPPALAGDVAHA
jgi:ABC-type thiamin/hydroxymethylpyrimidine transport system permease subunit